MYSWEELMEELKEDAYLRMYNRTYYYNKYSGDVFNGIHFENHKVALLHHLVDMKTLLLNRGIQLSHDDDHENLPFIEAVLVDSIPVKFAVDDKEKMVERHAKVYDVKLSKAKTIYKELMDILSEKIGLSTLVFTGWLETNNRNGHHMVFSEME